MPTQSQKNSQDIIKLQGEIKLIHNKIDTIKDNHLQHIDYKINNILSYYKMEANADGTNIPATSVRLNQEQIISKANEYFAEFRDSLNSHIGMLGDLSFSDYIGDDVLKRYCLPAQLTYVYSDYKYKFLSIVELKEITDGIIERLSHSLKYSQEQIFSKNLIFLCTFSYYAWYIQQLCNS